MVSSLDPTRGPAHSARMAASFDTLAAADALRHAGLESDTARAIATQIRLATGAVEAVTRPELEAALADLKIKLLDRIGTVESSLGDRIGAVENSLGDRIGAVENSLGDRIGNAKQRTADLKTELLDRIAESERRLAALLWRLFGGIIAVAGLAVAAAAYLVPNLS